MKKVRANDLIVMYKISGIWKAIAFATSCEIDISADVVKVGSPDKGKWKNYKKRKKTWKISTAHLMADTKDNPDLFDLLESDDPIQVCLSTVEAHPGIISHAEYRQDGRYQLTGSALVVRLTVTARKGDMVTMSAELQGTGPLKQVWADWVFINGLWSNSGVWIDEGIWK